MNPYWYFLCVIPTAYLDRIWDMTNKEMLRIGLQTAELVKTKDIVHFIGVILLIPTLPTMPRRDLWDKEPKTRYGSAGDLFRAGMKSHRFDDILRCIR